MLLALSFSRVTSYKPLIYLTTSLSPLKTGNKIHRFVIDWTLFGSLLLILYTDYSELVTVELVSTVSHSLYPQTPEAEPLPPYPLVGVVLTD